MKTWICVQTGCMLVPFFLTELLFISVQTESEKKRMRRVWAPGTLIGLLINGAVLLFSYRIIFGQWDLWTMLSRATRMEISYQEFGRMSLLLIPGLVVSGLLGWALHTVFLGKTRTGIARESKTIALLLITMAGMTLLICRNEAREGEKLIRFDQIYRKTTLAYLYPQGSTGPENRDQEFFAARLRNEGELETQGVTIWLSEMEEDLKAYRFNNLIIPAGESKLITMEYEKGPDLEKTGGSTLYLSDQYGTILDAVLIPALEEGQGYLRNEEDGTWAVDRPVAARRETARIAGPRFSRESGFYEEPFELCLEAEEGLTIHYTTDCSEPTKDSPVYTGPIRIDDRSGEKNQFLAIQNVRREYLKYDPLGQIPVDKATIVRAVTENGAGEISKTVTGAYFIGKEAYGRRKVLCLTADPEDLFGAERGIYVTGAAYDAWYTAHLEEIMTLPKKDANVKDSFWAEEPTPNFNQRGPAWEREADLIYFDEGKILLDQRVGLRIQGRAARGMAAKRFSIFARPKYSGSRTFDVPLFQGKAAHALLLRRGELHALSQRLGEGRNVLTMPWTETDVFLNGEYWYTIFLYEKMNETLIANTFGVTEGNIAIVKNGEVEDMARAGDNPYSAIQRFIRKNSLEDEKNYQAFGKIIDIQSYIDMNCIQVYLANTDYSENSNMLAWHTVTEEEGPYGDTRWRWSLYDMDLVWKGVSDVKNAYEINPFIAYPSWRASKKPITEWPIFSALMKNESFRQQFVTTFMDLANTIFETGHVFALLDEMGSTDPQYRDFFTNRREAVLPYVREAFGLKGEAEEVRLRISQPEAGTIRINTIAPDLSGGEWSGAYFSDYPVTVTAEARDGHRFSWWLVNGEKIRESTAEIRAESGGVTVTAVFDEAE